MSNETPKRQSMIKKRASDSVDVDLDENTLLVPDPYFNGRHKRFKGLLHTSSTAVVQGADQDSKAMVKGKLQKFHNIGGYGLSPITEISNNLSETTLADDVGDTASTKEDTDQQSANQERFQLPRNPATIISARRLNMDSPPTLDEMAIDELSFYNDDADDDDDDDEDDVTTAAVGAAIQDPHLSGLLSPEGSPNRFDVIDKSSALTKFLPSTACQQMLNTITANKQHNHHHHHHHSHHHNSHHLHNNNNKDMKSRNNNCSRKSTFSSKTPEKSLRIFHSLSNGSMESSMDDEYMELFEMESLDETSAETEMKFPSGLTSLIEGRIKNSSPPNRIGLLTKTSTTTVTATSTIMSTSTSMSTIEMRRPSVRRCLSMTEPNTLCATPQTPHRQLQPKTPELMKRVQETTGSIVVTTTPFSSSSRNIQLDDNANDLINYCFKRPEPPSSSTSPIQIKRLRADDKENAQSNEAETEPQPQKPTVSRPPVRKCMSMNDAEILSALARSDCKDEPDLIGDFSKPFALPLMEGRHRDLKSISSDTVARLLKGEFEHVVASYQIIDCRYPYEYEGGHIRGAKNLYTQEQIIDEFLSLEKTEKLQSQTAIDDTSNHKRHIIIFHCEFSSERGPKLSRFLRNNDRARNTHSYPALNYPEIYLLHNGYKEFYETHAELCDPIAYRPMLEPSYNEAYRHFRAKSKSWNGDGLGGGATGRIKKSRSRLLL